MKAGRSTKEKGWKRTEGRKRGRRGRKEETEKKGLRQEGGEEVAGGVWRQEEAVKSGRKRLKEKDPIRGVLEKEKGKEKGREEGVEERGRRLWRMEQGSGSNGIVEKYVKIEGLFRINDEIYSQNSLKRAGGQIKRGRKD